MKMEEPTGFQKIIYDYTSHVYFENTITSCIILNTIVMALMHYRQPDYLYEFSEQSNTVFAIVFNFECVVKILALGKVIYLRDPWNRFDMWIVFFTDVGILLKMLQLGDKFSSATTVIRGFRIMRLFKLIKSFIHMRLILDTIFNILPQVGNVMSLILLLLYIYAALGINLFSGIMLQDKLDDKNNF